MYISSKIMKLLLIFLCLLTFPSYSNTKSNFINKIKNCSINIQKNSNIDIYIPNNLIIAQAIIESNWGKSRFAKEGNNFFGMRTWDPKVKQLKPLKNSNAKFGLIVYNSICESVNDYIKNLNSSSKYQKLRNIRKLEIKLWGRVDSKYLARGLGNYSEERSEYVKKIINQIKYLERNYSE